MEKANTVKIYDQVVAKHYSNYQNNIIFNKCRAKLIECILSLCNKSLPLKILDIGCGDGAFLHCCRDALQNAQLFGVDSSKEMLEMAKKSVDFTAYHADALSCMNKLATGKAKFNIIVFNFISAYVNIELLLTLAKSLLVNGGIILYTANLQSSYPFSKKIVINDFKRSINPVKKIVAYCTNKTIMKIHNYDDLTDIRNTFEQHRFKVVDCFEEKFVLNFSNVNDWLNFMFKGGWGALALGSKPRLGLFFFTMLFNALRAYPKQDEQTVAFCISQYF